MANKELMITLGLDASSYSQNVRRAKDLNKELDSSWKLLNSSSEKFENSLQGLGKKQEYLSDKVKVATGLTEVYSKRLKECQDELDASTEEYNKNKKSVESLTEQMNKLKDASQENSAEYAVLAKTLKEKTQLLDKAEKSMALYNRRILEAKNGYNESQASVQRFNREIELTSQKMEAMKADEAIGKIKDKVSELDHSFALTKNSVANFESSMDGLSQTYTYLAKKQEYGNELLESYKKEMESSTGILNLYEKELSDVGQELEEWNSILVSMKGNEPDYEQVRIEVEGLRNEYTQISQIVDFHRDRMESLSSEYKQTELNVVSLSGKMDSATKKMQSMNDKVTFDKLTSQVKDLSNGLLTKLDKQMESLQFQFDVTSKSIGDYERSLAGLEAEKTHLTKSLKLAKKAFEEYDSQITSAKRNTTRFANEQAKLEEEIQKQIKALNRIDKVNNAIAWDEQAKHIENLKNKHELVSEKAKKHADRLKEIEAGYKESKLAIATFSTELTNNNKKIEELNKKKIFDGFDKDISKVSSEIKLLDDRFDVAKSSVENFDRSKKGLAITTENYTEKIKLLKSQMSMYENSIEANTQELNKLEKQQDEVSVSIDKLKAKMQSLGKSSPKYAEALVELARLENKYEDISNDIDKFTDKNDRLQSELNQTTAETNELTRATAKLNSEYLSDKLDGWGGKLSTAGSALSNIGNKLAVVTTGAVALGGAVGNVGVEFDAQMSKVSALTGLVGDELIKASEILEQGARNLAKSSKFTATEMAQGLEDLVLAGYDAEKAIATLPLAMQFAQAGTIELSTATEDLIMALSSLGENSELTGTDLENMEVMANMLAIVANATTTNLDGLAKSVLKVGGQVENMKIPLSTATTMIGILGDKGILAEEAGNSLNSILINLTQSTGQSAKAMEELGLSAFDAEGNIKPIEQTLGELKKKLDSFDGDKQEIILTNMLGGKTQAKTLQKLLQGIDSDTGQFIEKYRELKAELEGSIDLSNLEGGKTALENMADAMNDNLKGDIAIMMSQLQEGILVIFEQFEPQLREFVQNVTKLIGQIVEKVKDLTPEQKESIIEWGKFVLLAPLVIKGLGGILSIAGSVTSGIGGLVKVFGRLKGAMAVKGVASTASTAIGAVASSATVASGSVSGLAGLMTGISASTLGWGALIAGAVGMVGFTAKGIADALNEDVVPTVDLFADKVDYVKTEIVNNGAVVGYATKGMATEISEATKQSVGAYMDLETNATKALDSVYINSTILNQQTVDNLKQKYSEMSEYVAQNLTERSQNSINILQNFFDNTSLISEKNEQHLLSTHNQYYLDKIEQMNTYQQQIDEILQKASDENRKLTSEEYDVITALKERMRENAVQTLSEQEVESNIILQRMSDFDTRITAETMSENIKKLNEARDEKVAIAEDEYDKTLREIYRMRDESKTITADQADLLIEEAKRQRDGIVEKADDTRKEALKKMEKLGKDVYDQVNKDTGEILSVWDRLINKWESWFPSKKTVKVTVDDSSARSYDAYAVQQGVQGDLSRAVSSINDMQNTVTPRFSLDNYQTNGGYYSTNSMQKSVDATAKSNSSLIEALIQQNNILTQLLTAERPIQVGLNLDGKVVAKTTARYMDAEIKNLNIRKNRLGGSF